jgi:peptidoglycan/xylan/chitin deacetylase (PgdA/CDA1 family)
MKDSGFITFGSHTVNHKILSNQSSDTIMEELVRSKNVLIEKNVVNPLFIPFCYPNGNWNDDIVSMVRKSGYHLAVTTENGWNQSDTSLFALRRVGIHQDISSSQAMFGCRAAKMF